MKIAIIIVRSLLGLMFVFAAVVVLFKIPMEQPPMTPGATAFMTGLMSGNYFMTLLKVIELICGILLIVNFWAPLATVVLFPITVNILFFHAFLDEPKNLPSALFLIAANLFLAYAYRKNYAGLLMAKPIQ
ncbi:DoxX family membrane protein [Pedobacter sp. LMG 31464]|uniref:DoxX family membrane protein n=1 Tax=Pedobacter planticolens TaxID=2679964 RepID=A0A923IVS6_9SPHI|nr:DoxX family membrane protein [Pedobacter planticolens]MBB2144387.1 DoxX family membrane protein [Pedobacter planticolens]